MRNNQLRRTSFRLSAAVIGLLVPMVAVACHGSSSSNPTTSTVTSACDTCCIDVTNAAIRACEVVLEADATHVTTFDKSVRGSSQQMGTKVAVAFTARDDKPLSGSLVSFEHSDGGVCSLKLTSSTCYDRLGKTLNGGMVNFRGAKQ